MPRQKRRKLRTLSAPRLAQLIAGHRPCEVKYRNGKYVITRRWDGNVRGDTLHEGSVLNHQGQRKVLRTLGFSNDEIDELFG